MVHWFTHPYKVCLLFSFTILVQAKELLSTIAMQYHWTPYNVSFLHPLCPLLHSFLTTLRSPPQGHRPSFCSSAHLRALTITILSALTLGLNILTQLVASYHSGLCPSAHPLPQSFNNLFNYLFSLLENYHSQNLSCCYIYQLVYFCLKV